MCGCADVQMRKLADVQMSWWKENVQKKKTVDLIVESSNYL
jgi:hypothetical protein